MLRKPVQIYVVKESSIYNTLYALCNDGTIWKVDEEDMEWDLIPSVPQPGQEERHYHGEGEQNT